MDYRIRIWLCQCPDEELTPPKYAGCELTATAPEKVEFDNIPAEILLTMPDICCFTELTLSPDPSDFVKKQLLKYAQNVAESFGGAVEILQPDEGGQRFIYCGSIFDFPPVNEYTQKLYISLWYPKNAGISGHSAEITDIFSRYFPYCLPVKYGTTEPPEYTPENNSGIAGLNDFLGTCNCIPVLYGRLPVTHVFIEDAEKYAPENSGSASCIRIEIVGAMYGEPEWEFACKRLLKKLASLGQDPETGEGGAFFGQITLGQMQVASWWWKGIPVELGSACIIGNPYVKLIPDCVKGEKLAGDTVYFEEPDGPFIDGKLLSKKRKNSLFRKYAGADMFSPAAEIPEGIFGND